MTSLPLSLYIHTPWCIQKCPYCDFNSHQWRETPDFERYVDHLIADLTADIERFQLTSDRLIQSIFIGGGTPSLFPVAAIDRLLREVRRRLPFSETCEITLEANPNSADRNRFAGYIDAGVNRISIGVQSFQETQLKALGRVHSANEALEAITWAHQLPLRSFNIDLMHGLPQQTLAQALDDLKQAIAQQPPHLSWYQLTIEPKTLFYSKPPTLPDEDLLWSIYEEGHALLLSAGYQQYETSAYAKPGFQCQHNLNYWRYGDYLGIGCGAHGKITTADQQILRTVKTAHPQGYLQGRYLNQESVVTEKERPFEFFMNQFRLFEAVPKARFMERTFLPITSIEAAIDEAVRQGYVIDEETQWQLTTHGHLFLNSLLTLFMEEDS